MRALAIYRNNELAGTLCEAGHTGYVFTYDLAYWKDQHKPAISLTLSKSQQVHTSEWLFPFFFNMLSEGDNRRLQSYQLGIDEADDFGLLEATAQADTVGAITVKPILST